MTNTRKNIWTIENDPTDETLEWYGKAIGEMKNLPIGDNRSWRWQAAVHEYRRNSDPFSDPSDLLPSQADRTKYWDQCQHGSWFFIPWHRMYLHHFETIIRKYVVGLGGPVDWALPYWNYSDGPSSRLLPPSFRDPLLADGSTNHLYVAQRNSAANAGTAIASKRDIDLDCLKSSQFENPPFGLPEFGGGATGFSHNDRFSGVTERVPHGTMHGAVGGFMGRFHTAALDPIFWCHHCNIDRLWEVWVSRDSNHDNPNKPLWLRGVHFDFKDVNAAQVSMKCEEVEDTTNATLNYQYEDISDPIPATFGITTSSSMSKLPTLIAATNVSIEILGASPIAHASLTIPDSTPTGGQETFGVDADTNTIQLHIENLTSDGYSRGFDLYLGIPDGDDPENHSDKFVARIPLFGLQEASNLDGAHGGSGLSFSFNVTELINDLQLSKEIPVTFRSIDGTGDAPVKVGRISFYVD